MILKEGIMLPIAGVSINTQMIVQIKDAMLVTIPAGLVILISRTIVSHVNMGIF